MATDKTLITLLILGLLQIVDATCTGIFLSLGWQELNPIANRIIELSGLPGLLIAKLAPVLVLIWARRHMVGMLSQALIVVVGMYIALIAMHLWNMIHYVF